MPSPIKVPALGESITEAIIANWLQPVGARVEIDQPLVELETDKVTVEVPSPVAGTVAWLLSDEAPRVNGQVWDFEQYPLIGRNPPKETA